MNITFIGSLMNNTKSLNGTSDFDIPWVKYSQALNIWFAVNLTLCFFGATMNALLCWTIIRDQALRKGSGVQIAHLVAVEIFNCAVSMSIDTFMTYFAGKYKDGSSLCPFINTVKVGAIYTGQWAATFVAFTRFLAIIFPITYRKIHPWIFHMSVCLISASWVIGFADTLPNIWNLGARYERIPPWYNCGTMTVNTLVSTATLIIGQYLPGVLTTIFYTAILRKAALRPLPIHRRRTNAQASAQAVPRVDPTKIARDRRRLATVRGLVASSIFYWLCFFPNQTIITYFPWVFHQSPVLMLWVRTVLWCAYVFNPVSCVDCDV